MHSNKNTPASDLQHHNKNDCLMEENADENNTTSDASD
jgi:hypothetical protein